MTEPFWETNLILEVVAGSRAHGLATAASDRDTRGVCVPPRRCLLGLSEFEQHESQGGDRVVFALRKFARLALAANPNAIELLHTEEEDVLRVTELGRRLLSVRDRFLSRRVGERFLAYASQQLARMVRHRRWLVEPPGVEPLPEAFGARIDSGRPRWPAPAAQAEFKRAQRRWREYQDWRRRRNPERAALEERFGYDTKHAMHLARLVTMGEEILRDGRVRVRRPDADWLRGIRDGAMSFDELIEWAEGRAARLGELVAGSPLPEEPDRETVEAMVVEIHERFLFEGAVSAAVR